MVFFKTIGHAVVSGNGNAWVNDKMDFYASRTFGFKQALEK